ncbi:MAG: sugar transferase [Treponema sp.]|nr:sugar transferase [Candidatus Treponema caballi]
MKTDAVKPYYAVLQKKKVALFCKRLFDIIVSFIMLVILSPFFLILAIAIKLDSKGPVFYRQVRVTRYGKEFRIHKFRSMVVDADKGSLVTVDGDKRVTKVGKFIRKYRLDEISQLIDILEGNMTFVGTRPEVPKYVAAYTDEMKATLLLRAGVTSTASICYKDEAELLTDAINADEVYIQKILPEKMKYNLENLEQYSFWRDIVTMLKTITAVIKG